MYEAENKGFLDERLQIAIKFGSTKQTRNLLSEGVSPHLADINGCTPLHFACLYGHHEIVELLINDYHVDVNVTNKAKMTPLKTAKAYQYTSIANFLVEKGAIDHKEKNLTTPESPPMVVIYHKPKSKSPCCLLL